MVPTPLFLLGSREQIIKVHEVENLVCVDTILVGVLTGRQRDTITIQKNCWPLFGSSGMPEGANSFVLPKGSGSMMSFVVTLFVPEPQFLFLSAFLFSLPISLPPGSFSILPFSTVARAALTAFCLFSRPSSWDRYCFLKSLLVLSPWPDPLSHSDLFASALVLIPRLP